MSVSKSQQQREKPVHANDSSCSERKSTEGEVQSSQCHIKNIPFAPCDFHQKSSKKWLNNNANAKISHSQAAEQKFCRRMNWRHFVKRNENQSVAECCGESKKNVERKNECKEWCLINHPVKMTCSWEVSIFRSIHHSFEVHRRSRRRREKVLSGAQTWMMLTL